MKASRFFSLFILIGLFSTGLIFDNANALEFTHYYEENTTCAITTTTAQPVVVTDGTDFDFEDGGDYLIIATSTWGGEDNALTYEINMQHNATIFEGSQQIIEPKASNIGCSGDKDHYKYFFWTVWSPVGATQAGEDVSLNYVSNGGTDMLYDDVTIFVLTLDESLEEGVSWHFDENTTDEQLASLDTMQPETTFVGSVIDGEFTEQPATFFKDNGGDATEDDDGYVDCIRVFDVALNSTTANSLTSDTDTCWAFPDTSIPVPVRNYELNGDATDEMGGTDLQLSDSGTGLNSTGWEFLEADDAQIVAGEIPDTEYTIEMVLSFEGFTSDLGTYSYPRVIDFHNNEGAFDGLGVEMGLHLDEVGQTEDSGIWFWDISPSVEGTAFGGEGMTNNTMTHILFQRNSTGWFEAYKDGELAFTFDDNGDSWNTGSSASLSFTPPTNDEDWLIFGTALLGVDDIATNYETRLNYDDTTFTPLISKEGEDVDEQHLDSFTRVFTLNNTQEHEFTVQSRNDGTPVPANERLYNSIFALNLNKFESHNATYYESPLNVPESMTDFATEIMSLEIQNNATANWYIFSDFTKESDKQMYMRMQVDNVDQVPEQTAQHYEFGDNWDQDDWGMNGFGTFETLDNSTHTIDVDASMKDGAGNNERLVDSRSIWAITMNASSVQFGAGDYDEIDNPMSWTDSIIATIQYNVNATNPMSMTDDIRTDIESHYDNPMSMTDDIVLQITNVDDDPMSMTDDVVTMTTNTEDDPMSMIDDIVIMITNTDDDPMSMIDDIVIMITNVDDDPMSITDDIVSNVGVSDDDPMSWTDEVVTSFVKAQDDPMSWIDNIRTDVIDTIDNPMSITDDVDLIFMDRTALEDPMSFTDDTIDSYGRTRAYDDPNSWTDSLSTTVTQVIDNPMSIIDDIVLHVDDTQDDPMSMIDEIMIDVETRFEIIDPMSWTDVIVDSQGHTEPYDDPMSWLDTISTTFNQHEAYDNPMSMFDNMTTSITDTQEDPMSMLDNINASINNVETPDDPMSWLDDMSTTVMFGGVNATDPMSMIDSMSTIFGTSDFEDDPISMTDDIRTDVTDAVDNPMSMTDDIRIDQEHNYDIPMSFVDEIMTEFEDREGFIDPISIVDSTTDSYGRTVPYNNPLSITDDMIAVFNQMEAQDDPMSWIDNMTSTKTVFETPDDPMSWLDSMNATTTKLFSDDNPFSMLDNMTTTVMFGNSTFDDPMSMFDNMTAIFGTSISDDNPISFTDSIITSLSNPINIFDPMSWLDTVQFTKIIFEIEIIDSGTGGTGTGGLGDPAPTIPDSDGDGFQDPDDVCPNQIGVAPDGCPLVIAPPVIDVPFELTQLDVIDDNIVLDTESAQAQVEDLTIRWTGAEPITITNVEVGDSPFDIQIGDVPVQVGTGEFGISEYDIPYTVQEPFTICTNDFSFDCLAPVTYDIPVVVTGEIDGKIVITEGKIRVDNSDRLNPYSIMLVGIFAMLIIAIIFFKRRRKHHPVRTSDSNRYHTTTVGKTKTKMRVIQNPNTSVKAGTQRSKLSMGTKLNVINPKDRTKTDDYRYKILSEKQRKEQKKSKKKKNRLGF